MTLPVVYACSAHVPGWDADAELLGSSSLRGSEAARQRGSEAARQRGSEAARQRGSEAARQRGSWPGVRQDIARETG